jgi:hypothetical protein
VRGDGAGNLRDIEHALLALLDEQIRERLPDALRARGRRGEERFVAVVGRVIRLDEGANVDLSLPESTLEALPGGRRVLGCGFRRCGRGRRISAEFSPMPAVKTNPSSPPRTAVSAPISLAARYTK